MSLFSKPRESCCFCGEIISGKGNNPAPVNKGVCCDECNKTIVLPARARRISAYIG